MQRYAPWIVLGFFLAGIGMATRPLSPELAVVSAVAIVAFAVPAYVALVRAWGVRGAVVIALLGAFALAIESFAVATGYPYGSFSYNELLGGKVLGLAPWTVAFAWPPLVLGAVALGSRVRGGPAAVFVASLALLVGIDLLLDPGAVALQFWQWEHGSWYYGIPLSNYVGWVLSGAVGVGLVRWCAKKPMPLGAAWSYVLTLACWTGVMVGLQFWLAAAVGVGLFALVVRLTRTAP